MFEEENYEIPYEKLGKCQGTEEINKNKHGLSLMITASCYPGKCRQSTEEMNKNPNGIMIPHRYNGPV